MHMHSTESTFKTGKNLFLRKVKESRLNSSTASAAFEKRRPRNDGEQTWGTEKNHTESGQGCAQGVVAVALLIC